MTKEKRTVTLASRPANTGTFAAPTRRAVGLAGALLALIVSLLFAAPVLATTPATWRIDGLANSTTPADSTYRLNLQLANIGDEPADGSSGDPIHFTASLPPGMTVEGTDVENLFSPDPQHSEGVTIPFAEYGVFDAAFLGWQCSGDGPGPSPSIEGARNVSCSVSQTVPAHEMRIGLFFPLKPTIFVHVAAEPPSTELVSHFTLSGAGIPAASTAIITRVAPQPSFGIAAFDMGAYDATHHSYTQAAGHPFALTTNLDINTRQNPRLFIGNPNADPNDQLDRKFYGGPSYQDAYPVEPLRDVSVDLPPGLVGDASSLPQCKLEQLVAGDIFATSECPPASQIGTILIPVNPRADATSLIGPFAIYNLNPAPGSPATFAFSVYGNLVTLRARVRSESDYGISVITPGISQGLDIAGATVSVWGEPGSPVHEFERSCPNSIYPEYVVNHGVTCEAAAAGQIPFLRMPTSCTQPGEGLPWSIAIDSWRNRAAFLSRDVPDLSDPAWKTETIEGHEAPGYPLAPSEWGSEKRGVEGCEEIPFEPSLSVSPTTNAADSPSGLNVDLTVPQDCWAEESLDAESTTAACQSDLRKAVVKLPQGMTLNPSAAGGLGACSPGQVGLTTPVGQAPIHFDANPVSCPDASKVGNAEIQTPLLPQPLHGAVYLGKQGDNPFGSLLSLYLVIEDPERGIEVKLPGRVTLNEQTGQLETVFDDNPQLPFSRVHLALFGGPRAALRTPPTCGTYTTTASLTPWSGNPAVNASSAFQITNCGNGGFAPKLSAGTANPLAGTYSPFSLRLTREDGSAQISRLATTLPEGLLGKLKGVTYCPEAALAAIPREASGEPLLGNGSAQLAVPSCPASSQTGTITVAAGAGANPFVSTTGRLYLAGPYKGSPYSLAAIVPATAGPFDLGTVLVRNGVDLDRQSTAIKVASDPLPTMLHGVPLDLRDLRVEVNRPEFTVNPTSCDTMAVAANVASTEGHSAALSSRFQVGGCERLPFKPKLTLALKGKVNRSANPRLIANLTAKPGEANIAYTQVKLPPSAFLDNSHFDTICTRVQFAAHQCPAGSLIGKAFATTPLLNYPLSGGVYLRASAHKLPDVVVALRGTYGEPIEVDIAGKTDSVKGALRNTFEVVPDAPVSKFHLELFGGKKGLIEMSSGFCKSPRAVVRMRGQNGKVHNTEPVLASSCTKKRGSNRGHGDGGHSDGAY